MNSKIMPEVVELRKGFVPMRIPSVNSDEGTYKHIPLIELCERRTQNDQRLFYAYEILGKGRGCLRISKTPLNGKLKIYCDRVIALPANATSEIDLPGNMLALLQAHLALAFALRFGTSAVLALKDKIANYSTWFARHQSSIDRDTFIDPGESYRRFGRAW